MNQYRYLFGERDQGARAASRYSTIWPEGLRLSVFAHLAMGLAVMTIGDTGCGGIIEIPADMGGAVVDQGAFVCNPPAPPDPDAGMCPITPSRDKRNKDSNNRHDFCADVYRDKNDFWDQMAPASCGSDARVAGKNFDGVQHPNGKTLLYEMKVLDWENNNKYPDFIKKRQLVMDRCALIEDINIAAACGYSYDFVTTNLAHKEAVQALADDLEAKGEIPSRLVVDWHIVRSPCPYDWFIEPDQTMIPPYPMCP